MCLCVSEREKEREREIDRNEGEREKTDLSWSYEGFWSQARITERARQIVFPTKFFQGKFRGNLLVKCRNARGDKGSQVREAVGTKENKCKISQCFQRSKN